MEVLFNWRWFKLFFKLKQVTESSGDTEHVISQTIVSIPRGGGPIQAVSTLETIPGSPTTTPRERIPHSIQPSAPPMTGTSGKSAFSL